MASIRDQLIPLIEEGHIPKEKIDEALSITKVFPNEKDWLVFIGQASTMAWGDCYRICSDVFYRVQS